MSAKNTITLSQGLAFFFFFFNGKGQIIILFGFAGHMAETTQFCCFCRKAATDNL